MGDDERGHKCDKEMVLEFMVDGQKAIFEKLEKIGDSISLIAAQNVRISNLEARQTQGETRIEAIEQAHKKPDKPLHTRALEAAIIAVVVSLTVAAVGLMVKAVHTATDQQQQAAPSKKG